MNRSTTFTCYSAGLDLGQPHEATALAVVEKTVTADQDGIHDTTYAVRHLERFPIGMPYADVFARVIGMFAQHPLKDGTLAVGQTGVGRPVIKLLQATEGCPTFTAVTITSGLAVTYDERGGLLVPKLDLVGGLQVLLQTRKLRVAESLAEAPTLVTELTNFRVKPPPANSNDPLAAWREGRHDDLVFAAALAAWEAERRNNLPGVIILGEVPFAFGGPAWQRPVHWREGDWSMARWRGRGL